MQNAADAGDAAVGREQPDARQADEHAAGKGGHWGKVQPLVIFRQLFDPQSSTYTYLLADRGAREALLIDPVFEQARRDAALIEELGLAQWTLETHVHADHVTGAWLLKQKLGSTIAISAASGAEGADRYLKRSATASLSASGIWRRAPRPATPAAA